MWLLESQWDGIERGTGSGKEVKGEEDAGEGEKKKQASLSAVPGAVPDAVCTQLGSSAILARWVPPSYCPSHRRGHRGLAAR